MDRCSTHEVTNQVEPLHDYNLYDTDQALREAVVREGAGFADAALREHGAWLGQAQTFAMGRDANRFEPVLASFDPQGRRIDRVEFHPAWHGLMSGIVQRGLHSGPWAQPRPGAHVARAAGYLMQGQVEAGTLCPTTMTFGSIPVLMNEPAGEIDFARDWLPRLYSRSYDPSSQPMQAKQGALIGMGMTERQGGSDVRGNTTRATPAGAAGRGRAYLLTGHKWFFSVPQSDAHLVLAQADEGLSCFFVPRWLPDGSRNKVYIQRLKDKLGNRSNASSEVEFADAWGVAVGEPGRGVPTIVEMATHTRLDCVLGSAALLRQAVAQALHHASHRTAFGKMLAGHDLMRHVLCDLALESEAATVLALRLARAFEPSDDPLESAIRRIVTPAAKFWVCKRTVAAVGECMEVLGGNGYVEEGPLARLYREAPVNSIWEGSGNIMCLDVLRAMGRDADAFDALAGELRGAGGGRPSYDRALQDWLALCADTQAAPWHARRIAGMLALLMQCAMLIRHAPAYVADAFVESRLGLNSWTIGDGARAFSPQSAAAILTRAWQPAA